MEVTLQDIYDRLTLMYIVFLILNSIGFGIIIVNLTSIKDQLKIILQTLQ